MGIIEFRMRVGSPSSETLSVLYPAEHTDLKQALHTTINEITNIRLPPSRILIICRLGLHHRLEAAYKAIEDHLDGRLRNTTHISIAPYCSRGRLDRDSIIHIRENDQPWAITDDLLHQAATYALSRLVEGTNTILHAPAGYLFRKPSGREESYFIRAGNMLRELGAIPVVTHLLLRNLSRPIKTIYIDSFTILSFALGLQASLEGFNKDNQSSHTIPTIHNLHSYDKEPNFRFPPESNYIVLISASTSGSLAREFIENHGANPERILHLIGAGAFPNKEREKSCLYFYNYSTNTKNQTLSNRHINIVSEEFAVDHGPARPVSLGKNHVNRDLATIYKDSFYQENLKIRRAATSAGYGPYALFSIDNSHHLGSEAFDKWVTDKLIHELPASVHLLVHLDDPRSTLLSNKLKALLQGKSASLTVGSVPLQDLETIRIPNDAGISVVIVACEDPNLEGLTRASTSLRTYSATFRHYILVHSFPESMQRHRRRLNDLTLRSNDPNYGISEFLVTPVGDTILHEPLLRDYGLDLTVTSFDQIKTSIGDKLFESLKSRSQTNSHGPTLGPTIFFPKFDGDPLELRPGSIFFETGYTNISHAVAYLAVACALQNAREGNNLTSKARQQNYFDTNPFVRSVIAPTMFSRYSDGILQAALLRALAPTELDYSQSIELSWQFFDIAQSVLMERHTVTGEAALEFLAAMATDKVTLHTHHKEAMFSLVMEDKVLSDLWKIFEGSEDPIQ